MRTGLGWCRLGDGGKLENWFDHIMVYAQPGPVSQQRPRYLIIDVARGLAIIGVVIYHFVWDLRFLQFTGPDATLDFIWLWLARVLQVTFLSLTGVSLVLAHGAGMRWPAFWKRFSIIAAAALFVSVGTYIAFQEGFVYFGILHAIALFSLMAVPFLRAPLWLVIGVAVTFMSVPFIWQNEMFNARALSWIGFWTAPPYTQDLQPIFPGFGYTLAGIAVMRIILLAGWSERLERLKSTGRTYKELVLAGRWSLVIYLVHQPIMLSVLVPLANWLEPGQVAIAPVAQTRAEQRAVFYGSCVQFYNSSQGESDDPVADQIRADAYCSCAADIMDENDLLGVLRVEDLTPQQSTIYGAIPVLCQAMSE